MKKPPLLRSDFPQKFQRLGAIADSSFELFCFDRFEDLFEAWSGREAEGDQIAAADEWGRDEWFAGELGGLGVEKNVVVGEAVGGSAIDAMEFHFHVEGGLGHEGGRPEPRKPSKEEASTMLFTRVVVSASDAAGTCPRYQSSWSVRC